VNAYAKIRAALDMSKRASRYCVLPGLERKADEALAALAELEKAAGEPVADEGKLWTLIRSVMQQGADIHIDHCGLGYEKYSARLDAAAAERVAAFAKLYTTPPPAKANAMNEHPDDIAVDEFAAMLKLKLSRARAKGRSGWRDPHWSPEEINRDMYAHAAKGDPLDVAAYAMFLSLRGEFVTAPPPAKPATGVFTAEEMEAAYRNGRDSFIGWIGSSTHKLIQERTK